MSVEKEPLTENQFDRILEVASRESEEARRIVMFIRYTGIKHLFTSQEKNVPGIIFGSTAAKTCVSGRTL